HRLATQRTFTKYGQSGMDVSDLLPHTAACVDDLCVLRGCHGDSVTHPESVYLMNTGSILMGRPSLGAWAAYGLGTENRNMPAYVVLPDPGGWVKGGAPAWGNGFLPADYQGTLLRGRLARRMVERGVRFVQVYCGDTNGWDAHSDIEGNHGRLGLQSDLPVAGLLTDLKRRGLLDDTLVIWGGEFGRTPMTEGTNG